MDYFLLQVRKHRLYILLSPLLRAILPYLSATLLVGITALLLVTSRSQWNTTTVALLFLLPVLTSTTLWGLGPGVLAATLAFLSYNFFFLIPYYSFTVHETQDIIALLMFLVVAVLISQLMGRIKKNLDASLKREAESNRLYELSIGLAGVNDWDEIATIVAQKTLETFQAQAVNISVESLLGEKALSVNFGKEQVIHGMQPEAVAPIESSRGFLGEIRMWSSSPTLAEAQTRLLHIFAAQSALALERTALAHAETRTQVVVESDRLKSALLSSISHEFRTPLAAIKASVSSLLSRQVDLDSHVRHELLSAVDEEVEYLDHLVSNLLNMTRIEAGALHPNREWNYMAEIINGVVARMHRILNHHLLRVEIPDDLPLIPVDYLQMEQVFTNLISNSVKYAPPGSEILLRLSLLDEDWLLARITNQGPDVSSEHLGRIFDKFHRVTDAEKVSGTGLGLSICKGIVEAHGGQIWAENRPEGFTISLKIPLALDGKRAPVVVVEEA